MKYLVMVIAAMSGSLVFGQTDDLNTNLFEACYLIVKHANGKATVGMFRPIVNDQNGKVYEAQAEDQIVRLFHNSGKPTQVGTNSLALVLQEEAYERQVVRYTQEKNLFTQKAMAEREERIAEHSSLLTGDPKRDAVIYKMIAADKTDKYEYYDNPPAKPMNDQSSPVYWMYQAGVRGSSGMSTTSMPVAPRFTETVAGVDSEQKLFRLLVDPTTYQFKNVSESQTTKHRTVNVSCAPIM